MPEIKPRKPLFASLMSLILPGFGQLYNGEINKAIWVFVGFGLLSVPGIALIALYLPNGWMMPALACSIGGTMVLWLYGIIEAWRSARLRIEYVPERWQISGMYVLVFILCDLLFLPVMIDFVRTHQVESFHIPSTSMEPGVLQGDILFADKRYNCGGCKQAIQRGDIAIFTYPNDRTLKYIKRIIALPGDHVRISGPDVRVNGVSLSQDGTATPKERTEAEDGHQWRVLQGADNEHDAEADLVVPPGQVFVLGDNRSVSTDSRKFGTVPMQDVVGRARQVWFSRGNDGIRWTRLGLVVQ